MKQKIFDINKCKEERSSKYVDEYDFPSVLDIFFSTINGKVNLLEKGFSDLGRAGKVEFALASLSEERRHNSIEGIRPEGDIKEDLENHKANPIPSHANHSLIATKLRDRKLNENGRACLTFLETNSG